MSQQPRTRRRRLLNIVALLSLSHPRSGCRAKYMDRDRFVELVNVVINYYYYSPVTHCSRPMVADYLQINCQGNVEDSYSLRQDRTITLSDNEDDGGGGGWW